MRCMATLSTTIECRPDDPYLPAAVSIVIPLELTKTMWDCDIDLRQCIYCVYL